MESFKTRAMGFYEKNEVAVDASFFLAGVLFDIFTLSAIDDVLSIVQQVGYLLLIGSVLYFDFLHRQGHLTLGPRIQRFWEYRDLALHFVLGSLLSVYSIFFVKSASFFASFVFILAMLALMVANELKPVQRSGLNIKIAMFFICVFSFFSMMFPLLLGFVGWVPFLLALAALAASIEGSRRLVARKIPDPEVLKRALVVPGATVAGVFLAFYLLGWIPPVPLSVKGMGIYHGVMKENGHYVLSHENPWWRFWHSGDQDFKALPGDGIHVFVRIFSPARFSDSVVLHWQRKSDRDGWTTTDRIPMGISGGREEGFRGTAVKKNYEPGEWRVKVETTDGREIGRMRFDVTSVPYYDGRVFQTEIQ